jgi:hypothetical protein
MKIYFTNNKGFTHLLTIPNKENWLVFIYFLSFFANNLHFGEDKLLFWSGLICIPVVMSKITILSSSEHPFLYEISFAYDFYTFEHSHQD